MNATHSLARLVHGFFQEYMAAQKGLSPNTILSYRDAVKLFLGFTATQVDKPVDRLVLEDFDEQVVLRFLDDLEASRGNCTAVRNNRLAALRAFFRYAAGQEPLAFARCQRICTIATKRKEHQTIEYLEDNAVAAVLKSIDRHSRKGSRDYALLLFLYNLLSADLEGHIAPQRSARSPSGHALRALYARTRRETFSSRRSSDLSLRYSAAPSL